MIHITPDEWIALGSMALFYVYCVYLDVTAA